LEVSKVLGSAGKLLSLFLAYFPPSDALFFDVRALREGEPVRLVPLSPPEIRFFYDVVDAQPPPGRASLVGAFLRPDASALALMGVVLMAFGLTSAPHLRDRFLKFSGIFLSPQCSHQIRFPLIEFPGRSLFLFKSSHEFFLPHDF